MVANHPSGFFDLAAAPRQPLAVAAWPTSPRKTRVRGFRRHASGRLSSRRRCRSIITPGSRGCAYKTVSGRHEWPNRDPLGEPGFELVANRPKVEKKTLKTERIEAFLKLIATVSPETVDALRSRLVQKNVNSGPEASQDTVNLYVFVGNDPVVNIDGFGLFSSSCLSAPPLKSSDCACDAYGNEKYPILGVSLKCFCKCAGDSAWSQAVRGCLACSHAKGENVEIAHAACYAAATAKYGLPPAIIAGCYISCGGYVPPPPYPPIFPGLPPGLGGF